MNHRARRQTTRPTATIHPIAADPSGLDTAPAGPGPGHADETTPPPSMGRLVLTVDEAAYLLNIFRSLAYELIARGELPALRLGRRIVIPRVMLEELLGTAIR
ncbi:MAG TPA: helix-turn-helix domain-containing protein [Acidimicrobiales bacterium]|nr:helix-turn-helix domain-containing protein [Acidimicrobiales bacterium]